MIIFRCTSFISSWTLYLLILMCMSLTTSYAQNTNTFQHRGNNASSDSIAGKVSLRICTGSPQNHYYRVALMIAQAMSPYAVVKVMATKGSWENLGRIHTNPPHCDAIIAQDDAYTIYTYEHPNQIGVIDRLTPLYSESIHLLCHKGIAANSLSELSNNTRLLVGSYGSGTFITWSLMRRLNPQKYSALNTHEVGGVEALMRVSDGVQAQCMLNVGALAQGILAKANDDFGTGLKLLNIKDPAFQTSIQQGNVAQEGPF